MATAAKKWTDKTVDNLKVAPGEVQTDYPDPALPGLSLRVSERSKTWTLAYRCKVNGQTKRRRMTLGHYVKNGGMSLAQARAAATAAKESVRLGGDPVADAASEKARRRKVERWTFEQAAIRFVNEHARPRRKSWRETARLLGLRPDPKWDNPENRPESERPLVPTKTGPVHHFKNWMIDDIRRADVREMLAPLETMTATRNRTLAATRKMFNWLVGQDRLEHSPVTGIEMLDEQSRERELTAAEIKALWKACDDVGAPFGPLHKMLLLTAQRLSEVAGMLWSELDLDAGIWSLSSERTKANRPHAVPLSRQALAIIRGIDRVQDQDHVFASGLCGDKAPSGFSKAKRALDKAMAKHLGRKTVEDWHTHDLRRTAATALAKAGTSDELIGRILNHAPAGVTAIYNRFKYFDERREALQRWADTVEAMVGNEAAEVVEMRAAG